MEKEKSFTLYAYTFLTRAERVMWMLNELALPYELIRLDPLNGETLTPEFKALNPSRKVPVLIHGERVITESLAIMEYLHTQKPEMQMVPSDPNDVCEFRQLVYFMQSEIEAYLWVANQSSVLQHIYPWPEGSYDQAVTLVQRNIRQLFKMLDGKKYLIGDAFGMADIYAFSLLSWAKKRKVELPDFVEDYMAHLAERPACYLNSNLSE